MTGVRIYGLARNAKLINCVETTREIGTEDGTGKLRVTLEKKFGSIRVGSITCLEFREAYAFRVTSVVRNELTEKARAGTWQRGKLRGYEAT